MEWDKQQQPQPPPPSAEEQLNGGTANNNNGGMFVKVMTDEQMEVLRKQIAVYATICEQLVDLHKSLTSHHDLAGRFLFLPILSLSCFLWRVVKTCGL